jgi:hypothetical protein
MNWAIVLPRFGKLIWAYLSHDTGLVANSGARAETTMPHSSSACTYSLIKIICIKMFLDAAYCKKQSITPWKSRENIRSERYKGNSPADMKVDGWQHHWLPRNDLEL